MVLRAGEVRGDALEGYGWKNRRIVFCASRFMVIGVEMGLFDKAKGKAAEAAARAQSAMVQKADEAKEVSLQKRADDAERKELASMFRATQKFDDIEVDAKNKLIKIKRATGELPKKKSGLGTATAAVVTLGVSAAVSAATKPRDVVVPFSSVRGYSVIQDEDTIQGGSLGAAAIGGILFGGVGAAVGAVGGKRKNKKAVNTMALRIDLSSFELPCAMISYISKPTKTTDKDYTKAVSSIQSAMSCLDMVLEGNERQAECQL